MVLDFSVETRGEKWFCVSLKLRAELAPAFDKAITAAEIAQKVNNRERYFNAIPLVPIGTGYPRPADIVASADAYPDRP